MLIVKLTMNVAGLAVVHHGRAMNLNLSLPTNLITTVTTYRIIEIIQNNAPWGTALFLEGRGNLHSTTKVVEALFREHQPPLQTCRRI